MVVALREQQPKKSKLSLFRLGKSSSKSNSNTQPSSFQRSTHHHDNSIPRSSAAPSYSSYSPSAEESTPRQPHRHVPSTKSSIVTSSRQAASEGAPAVIPVHYQYPEASNLPANYHWSSSSESTQHYSDQDSEHHHYHRTRADSLPLQGFVHPADTATSPANNFGRPNLPALARIQTDMAPSSKHSRQRSHFSIPDVIVTTCEEEGEQELVQLEIPPNKRRSYVLRDAAEDRLQDHRSNKKSSSGFVPRPAPLIHFNDDEIKNIGMTRSGSNHSIASSPVSPSTTVSATSPSTPSSSASSSLSKASTTKRTRKSSFPLLFGRKSLDSSRSQGAVQQTNVEEPLPFSSITPASAPPMGADSFHSDQPGGLLFSSHESGPVSAPPSRSIFTRAMSGLPSPPITPTWPPRQLSKKEIKAKAKEELALIKELERVDKLVKQHDVKARKAQEKAEAKERKRAAKLAQANQQFHLQGGESRPSMDTCGSAQSQGMPAGRLARKTIFQAATKASATAGLARRTSIRGAPEPRSFVGERRGSEPTLSRTPAPVNSRVDAATPFSIDLPASERLPFTEPRAAPRPILTNTSLDNYRFGSSPQNGPASPSKQTPRRPSLSKDTSPPRPMRPAPPVPATNIAPLTFVKDTQHVHPDVVDAETSIGEDADETRGWNRQSWSELNSGFTGPLPSLIQTSGSSHMVGGERGTEEMDRVLAMDEQRKNARMARRASVQRVLALSDVESGILQKRSSVRKRGSQQYLKRRSSHLDGGVDVFGVQGETGGCSSKRSSLTSDGRRRSFIRSMADDEGWKVVQDAARPDDSVVVQPDLSEPEWDDWIEDEEREEGRIPASQSMEIEVDMVLADLRAAQQADHVRKTAQDGSGERTPTQETVKDPFASTSCVQVAKSSSSSSSTSSPRPNRPTRRNQPVKDTHHTPSNSYSSNSSCSHSSGTQTTTTLADIESNIDSNIKIPTLSSYKNDKDQDPSGKTSDFKLSLTLTHLLPLDFPDTKF